MNIGMASPEQGREKTGNGFDAKSAMDSLAKLREGTEGRNRRELAAFYRDAARKRSPEYMKNLERLAQLRAKRNELLRTSSNAEIYSETSMQDETSIQNEAAKNSEVGIHGEVAKNNDPSIYNEAALSGYTGVSEQASTPSNLAQIDKEIEDVGKKLEKEMPQGSVLLTLIFWDLYKNELAQQGIIAPGDYETFTDAEDLIRKCGVEDNEKAKEQLRRGNSEFRRLGPACMAVEIHLDAICVIYPDGAVRVLRGDPELGV